MLEVAGGRRRGAYARPVCECARATGSVAARTGMAGTRTVLPAQCGEAEEGVSDR